MDGRRPDVGAGRGDIRLGIPLWPWRATREWHLRPLGAVDRDRRDAAEAQRQEQLAAERAREQAQERQQAQEREKVADKFRAIAGKREVGAHGYGDHNSDWEATPEALRKAVDAYNGANQHTKDLYIEQIQREPQMARAVGQLLHERELVLQRDRGMSL